MTDDLNWKTSSFSTGGGQCVEVAALSDGTRFVRHSQDPNGGALTYTPNEWRAFVQGVKTGEFD